MYSYTDRVSYSEIDSNQQLTYFSLVNYLQDCSCFHSEEAGVGLDYLVKRHIGWFVTGYEIHIIRMPKYAEKIVISTYPYQVKGLMAHRDYAIALEDGSILAYANSLWVLMDLQSGKPARITQEMEAGFKDEGRPEFKFESGKLFYKNNGEKVGNFKVSEIYIDTNGHMNNSYYIDVTRRFLPEDGFKSIRINYKKAAQLFDELDVYLVKLEDGYQVILIKDDEVYTIVEYK